MTLEGLARRQPLRLHRDPSRVIAQLFVAGHALPGPDRRASSVVDHVVGLDDVQVEAAIAEIVDRFGDRHRDLPAMLRLHAERIRNRLGPGVRLSEGHWLLLGAVFTHECAVAGAALCNPSIVPHPDQSGMRDGDLRFVMSVREIGEGHRSTLGFRTGSVRRDGIVSIDGPGPYTTAGATQPGLLEAANLRDGAESTDWVLDRLDERFTVDELAIRLGQLERQLDTRRDAVVAAQRLRALGDRTYTATFPADAPMAERVLFPATGAESNGIEDARLVRFDDGDGASYLATYVAYDGAHIAQQLLTTDDFLSFESTPVRGTAAANKGLAIFPRRVGGRYAALTRHDGANNGIAFSEDIRLWPTAAPLARGDRTWEAIQVGNCGAPVETDDGWLVLTHGVGPMRTYSIGAMLLDLDDPTVVLARLREPLLTPAHDEQDGYVPNVVYSCGVLVHAGRLVIPYGIGDASIGFADVGVADLLAAMA